MELVRFYAFFQVHPTFRVIVVHECPLKIRERVKDYNY